MNRPYVKEYKDGICTNPITKENPYLHRFVSEKRRKEQLKYIAFHHPVTGEFVGKVKVGGNNRKFHNGKKRNLKF
jgi:hypothetical protein